MELTAAGRVRTGPFNVTIIAEQTLADASEMAAITPIADSPSHFRVRHPEFEVRKYFASQADNSSQLWIQITPARTAFEDPPRRQPG